MRVRPWLKKQEEQRRCRVAAEVEEAREGYDFGYDPETEELKRELFAEDVRQIHSRHPELRIKPRTWTWWPRWALAALLIYVGAAYLVYGFRHPEMTDVECLLDFWGAMTWR